MHYLNKYTIRNTVKLIGNNSQHDLFLVRFRS